MAGPAPVPFEAWKKNLASLNSASPEGQVIDSMREIWLGEKQALAGIFDDSAMLMEKRSVAALRLSLDPTRSPAALAVTQAFLFEVLHESYWVTSVSDAFLRLICEQWRCQFSARFKFPLPQSSIPALEAACQADLPAVAKIASIILTAMEVLPIRSAQEIKKTLRKAVEQTC